MSDDILSFDIDDSGVAKLVMDDSKANAFSNAMFDAVNGALDRAEKEAKIIVLRGRTGIFSGGYNLKELMLGGDVATKLVRRGSDLAIRMMEMGKPIITVGDGHIVALGGFIFLAADYRIALNGAYQVGLPETAKGLPMHNFGRELAAYKLNPRYFSRAFINGEMFTPDAAVDVGFVDVATDDADAATTKATDFFKSISLQAFAINKPRGYQTVLPVLQQAAEDDMSIRVPGQ